MIVTPSRFIPKKGHLGPSRRAGHIEPGKIVAPEIGGPGPCYAIPRPTPCAGRGTRPGGAVEFAPPMPHGQLFPLIQSADAVVIPSLREPFGIAAAEAMLLGVPVVLTRVDGFLELVGDSEGAVMVSPNDPRGLAEAIWSLK